MRGEGRCAAPSRQHFPWNRRVCRNRKSEDIDVAPCGRPEASLRHLCLCLNNRIHLPLAFATERVHTLQGNTRCTKAPVCLENESKESLTPEDICYDARGFSVAVLVEIVLGTPFSGGGRRVFIEKWSILIWYDLLSFYLNGLINSWNNLLLCPSLPLSLAITRPDASHFTSWISECPWD